MVFSSMWQKHDDIIKRLSEATEFLSGDPRTEVRGFCMISALRADKYATKTDYKTEYPLYFITAKIIKNNQWRKKYCGNEWV